MKTSKHTRPPDRQGPASSQRRRLSPRLSRDELARKLTESHKHAEVDPAQELSEVFLVFCLLHIWNVEYILGIAFLLQAGWEDHSRVWLA